MPLESGVEQDIDFIASTAGLYDTPRYRVRVAGEEFDRLQIKSDGSVVTGDGTIEPDIISSGAGLLHTAGTETATGAKTFTGGLTVSTTGLTITDVNVVLSATTGTKIGTATTQKLGFYNATPVVQPAGTVDVLASLVTLGLRAASSNPPLNLGTGALTSGDASVAALTATSVVGTGDVALTGHLTVTDAKNIVLDSTTGTKIGTATTQKLGFYNATPVAQPAGTDDVLASLVTLGLRAASSNPPLNLGTGALTAGASVFTQVSVGSDAASNPNIIINGGVTQRSLLFRTASNNRWQVYADSGTESGSNAGSDFSIAAYNDAGASLATYLTIRRSDGRITFADNVNLAFNSTTGTKIGLFTNDKMAFHGSTPVIQRVGAAQAAVATTGATNVTPYGFTTAAQADAIVTLVNELRAALVEKGLIKGAA